MSSDDWGSEDWELLLGGPDDNEIEDYLNQTIEDEPEFDEFDVDEPDFDGVDAVETHVKGDALNLDATLPTKRPPGLSKPVSHDSCSYLGSPPFRFVPFNNRMVGVALTQRRLLVLVDPKGQRDVDVDRLRVYVVTSNKLAFFSRRTPLREPTEQQALMAASRYRTFLNPSRKLATTTAQSKSITSKAKRPLPTSMAKITLHHHEYLGSVLYWPLEKGLQEMKRVKVFFVDESMTTNDCCLKHVRVETFSRSFPKVECQQEILNSNCFTGIPEYLQDFLQHIDEYDMDALASSEFAISFLAWAADRLDGDISSFSLIELMQFFSELLIAELVTGKYRAPNEEWQHALLAVHLGQAAPDSFREKLWRKYQTANALKRAQQMEVSLGWAHQFYKVVDMYRVAALLGSVVANKWLNNKCPDQKVEIYPVMVNMDLPETRDAEFRWDSWGPG